MQTQIFTVHKRHLGLRAPTVLALGFALTILVGALVLMLPVSAADGQITPFLDALFTAASASCVTGLVTVSTAVHWSVFGKCVILLLIQIGGLGFMSVAAIASFVLRRTITLHERMVMSAGLNLSDGGGIVRLCCSARSSSKGRERFCCPAGSCRITVSRRESQWACSTRFRHSATQALT